jgi:hypothetical protein
MDLIQDTLINTIVGGFIVVVAIVISVIRDYYKDKTQ